MGAAADLTVKSITSSILQGLGTVTGGTGAACAGNAYQNNDLGPHDLEAYKRPQLFDPKLPKLSSRLRNLHYSAQNIFPKIN